MPIARVRTAATGAVLLVLLLGTATAAGADAVAAGSGSSTTTTTTTATTSTTTTSTTTTSTTTTSPAGTPATTQPPATGERAVEPATVPASGPAPGAPATAAAPSVAVTPSTGLVTGQTVTVAGSGFAPSTTVGWAECKAGPGTQSDCDSNNFGTAVTDDTGSFSAQFAVRRMMHAPSGTLDCAAAPGTCKLAVGQLDDLTVTAWSIIDFDPSAPLPPPPVLQAAPTTNLVDGQQIAVLGTGFVGSTPIMASECITGTNQCGSLGGLGAQVSPVGTFLTVLSVQRRIAISQWASFDCASTVGACELMVVSQGDPDAAARLVLDFDAGSPTVEPVVTVTPDSGLVNFQTVTIAGSGYDPSGEFPGVGITVCKTGSVADGDCVNQLTFAQLDPAGAFSTTMTLRRLVHFPSGDFDCGSAPVVCEVRAASFAGSPRIGSAPFSFADGPPPPPPGITVTPDTQLVSRQTVTVSGANFAPNTFVDLRECPGGTGVGGPCTFFGGGAAQTDGSGAFTTTFVVSRGITTAFFPPGVTDCAVAPGACELSATSFDEGDFASAPITFDASVPVVVPSVTVTPSLDLPDRQVVRIDASGFSPYEIVYVDECPAGAALCSNIFPPSTTTGADANGEIHTSMRVRRELAPGFTPAPTNCAVAVGACVIRVASLTEPLSRTDAPLGFDPTAVVPGPALVASPPGPWADGQQVTLSGSGFTPGAQLGVAECTATGDFDGSTCARSLFDPVWADADGNFTLTVTITRTFESQDATIDCARVQGGCVLFAANRQDYGAERASLPLELSGASRLAFTGSSSLPVASAGATALGLGLALLLLVRRRRTTA